MPAALITTQRVGQRLLAVLLLLCLSGCGRITPPQQSHNSTPLAPSPNPASLAVATLVLTPAPTQTSPVPTISLPTPTLPELGAAPATSAELTAELTELEAQLVAAVNELRMQHGLPAYTLEPSLSDVARAHSCDLAAHGSISHTSSDGRTLAERLGADAARWSWPSESIAAATADPAEVIALWLDEPLDGWHRRNLLDPEQRVVGVGYCATPDDPSGNRVYWTMIVTRPAR